MLNGVIEADEVYLGGKEKNKHVHKRTKDVQGRSTKTKVMVVGLRERGGQLKARAFSGINPSNMREFSDQNVEHDSVLCTDEGLFYQSYGLSKMSSKSLDERVC